MEIDFKNASAINTKSIGSSSFVQQFLGGGALSSQISSTAAFNIWELSDVVYNCIDLIAAPFSQMEYVLKDKKTKEIITDHPFLELLQKPGFMQSSTEVMYSLMTSFLVAGSAMPVLSGNVNFDPVGLSSVYSNKANLTPDNHNDLLNISFSNGEDSELYKRQLIPKRNIAVYQTDSKLSETIQILKAKRSRGIEPSTPMSRIIHQAHTKYFGNIHNSNILKNGSRLGGLWSSDTKTPMTQEQYESFKMEVQNNFSGPNNAGKNVVSPVPVKYENFLLNTRDMDFIKLIEASGEDIYNIYNIPLALKSAKTMTMSNFSNSQTALYDMAVIPNSYMLLFLLGSFALPRYKDGDRYELTFDEKTLPALRARMLETAETMRKVAVYKEDEIRSATGHEKLGAANGGEDIYKPANLVIQGDDLDDMGGNVAEEE